MKIGRNDPCLCGSGKKYKKCCIDKKENDIFEMLKYINPFEQHDYYIHSKKVKLEDANNKLLYANDNRNKVSIKEILDNYIEGIDMILDYSIRNNLNTSKEIDNANLIGDFFNNIIQDLIDVVFNASIDEYDLIKIDKFIDKLIKTVKFDYDNYESIMRCKTHNLFKLSRYDDGEKIMLNLIKNTKTIYPYVELVDDFEMFGNIEKSKYYFELGMIHKELEDFEVLEERCSYFEERK